MRDSFIFYASWMEAIKNLQRDIQGEVLTAIIEYGLYGETTDNLKPITRAMLTMVKPMIDVNNQRYENGKKGGRPRANNNQSGTKVEPNKNQDVTKSKPNDNVYVNDNIDNNTEYSNEYPVCETSQPHPERINYEELINFFNEETKGVFGTIRSPLSNKRKGMINARIKVHGKETFANMIRKAYQSDFLKGQNKSAWRASFDWLIKPTNFEKVISGNYDNNDSSTSSKSAQGDEDFMRNIAEGIARANFERDQRG